MAEHSSDITDWGVRTNYSLSSQGAMYGHLYPASNSLNEQNKVIGLEITFRGPV